MERNSSVTRSHYGTMHVTLQYYTCHMSHVPYAGCRGAAVQYSHDNTVYAHAPGMCARAPGMRARAPGVHARVLTRNDLTTPALKALKAWVTCASRHLQVTQHSTAGWLKARLVEKLSACITIMRTASMPRWSVALRCGPLRAGCLKL